MTFTTASPGLHDLADSQWAHALIGERSMQYAIISYVGAGPITLGMTREEVCKAINAPVREFRQMPSDEYSTALFEGPESRWNIGIPGSATLSVLESQDNDLMSRSRFWSNSARGWKVSMFATERRLQTMSRA